MPAVLREHQHELAEPDTLATGVVFGTEDTGYLTLSRPVVAAGDPRLGDSDRAYEDGRSFGRDYIGAKSYTFEIGVLTDAVNGLGAVDPHAANLDALNALETAWTDEKWRRDPTAMAMLRSCEAGRVSRCYGRPRRYDEAAGTMTKDGYTPVVAAFDLIDSRWYADVEDSVDVSIVPPTSGGFTAPLVAPINTTLSTSAEGIMVVGGAVDTWPVVEFHGPVTAPSLTIGEVTIGLDTVLAYDHVITVDPRPWSRQVVRNTDGAGFAGALSAATPRLVDMRLRPGTYPVTFTGTDATGTSFARIRWRTARARP